MTETPCVKNIFTIFFQINITDFAVSIYIVGMLSFDSQAGDSLLFNTSSGHDGEGQLLGCRQP